MTRRTARQRSPRKRSTLRRDFASHGDLLQLLRLLALASPELAGLAFMCHGGVETSILDRELVVRADARRHSESRVQRESRGGVLSSLPSAEAHIVRLPLVPTLRLERERQALGHRVRRFASSVAASIGRAVSGR